MGSPDVEVRRSRKRRRTVSAYREDGRTIVLIPARFTKAEEQQWVATMLDKLAKGDKRRRPSDAQLRTRSTELSQRYLGGQARPTSIRWVTNQNSRWGSCTPADGTIRISTRVKGMPGFVLDYVILHELAHLLSPGHGSDFWALLEGYPRLERARGYLEGVAATAGLDLSDGETDSGELGQAALDFGPSD
jgi:predicted metal-dependent hydrolase